MTKNEKIFFAIRDAFKNDLCDWSDIIKSVEDANIPINNWLVVRGVLQWMIRDGMVVRTKNIHEEVYQCLKEIKL